MAKKQKATDKVLAPGVVRPLGLYERFAVAITNRFEGLDCWILVSARYTANEDDTHGVLDKPTLYAALAKVVVQQPHALCVYIDGGRTKHPVFRRLESINLSEIVLWVEEDTDLVTQLETQLMRPIVEGTPLWRLVVLKDNTVIFALFHAIGDGQSGRAFHISLLSALNELSAQPPSSSDVKENIQVPTEITLLPAIEDLVHIRVRLRTLCKELWQILAPAALSKRTRSWSGKVQPKPVAGDLSVKMRLLYFLPDQVDVLRNLARQHKATITSVLHTIGIVVLSRIISTSASKDSKQQGKKYKRTFTTVPISLRRYTGAPPTAICEQVSGYYSYRPLYKPGKSSNSTNTATASSEPLSEFPWSEASKYAAEIHAYAPKSPEQLGLVRFIADDYEGYLKSLEGKQRRAAIELSNLGPYPSLPAEQQDASKAKRWGIEEMYFAQADVTNGAALKLNVMGSPTGGLGISVTWSPSSVEGDVGREFASGVEGMILELIGTKKQ